MENLQEKREVFSEAKQTFPFACKKKKLNSGFPEKNRHNVTTTIKGARPLSSDWVSLEMVGYVLCVFTIGT